MSRFWRSIKVRNSLPSNSNNKCHFDSKFLKNELEVLLEKNVEGRQNLRNLYLKGKEIEEQLLSGLKKEISGPIICALKNLQPLLAKLQAADDQLDEALESWAVLNSLLVEYSALWQVIAEDRPTWDTADVVEESPDLLNKLVETESKLKAQALLRTRMATLRIEQMEKILPHLGSPWPKLAETSAVDELAQVLKFQIGCLKHSIKIFEAENEQKVKFARSSAKKHQQFEKIDKFGKSTLCACFSTQRPLTSANLQIWLYSPLGIPNPQSSQGYEMKKDEAGPVKQSHDVQVWHYLGGTDWRMVGQIVRLVQHLKDVESRQIEVQTRLDELQQVEHQFKKVRNERNLLQHELSRNRKFLTQIMLEKMVHQNTRLRHLLVNASYPQSADLVVQELVQKNIELSNQVQELEEVVRYSREDSAKHQERSRTIINCLNKAINSLEEVAIEFVLHEKTDQDLIFKLKAIVEKDRMQRLMSMLNEDDLQVLQESLQKGNVGEVLIRLTEDLDRQRANFCSHLRQMGQDERATVIGSMSATQLSALSEAISAERLETATELLQSSRPSVDFAIAPPEGQVTEVMGQLQQLLEKIEKMDPGRASGVDGQLPENTHENY